MNEDPTSRRNFLARTGAAAGALAVTLGFPGAALGRDRRRKRVYRLAPEGAHYHCSASQETTHNCEACKACHKHAQNKLFATREAAQKDRLRAHPGCRCGVKRGRRVPKDTWHDLFRPKHGKDLEVVDKRDRRVQRILGS